MRCPLCQTVSVEKLYDMGLFALMQCSVCRLVFQDGSALPTQDGLIGQIYDDGWVKMKEAMAIKDLYNHCLFYSHITASHCPPGGSLLEVGCGTGEFLYLMRQTGRMVRGVEPSAVSSTHARGKYNLDIVNSVWDKGLLGPEEKYDAVVFWHVLEHIQEPVKFLAEAKIALKVGGCVIFCVPNNDCFTNIVLRQHSPVYAERDHMFHYSASNLPILLEQSGLRPVRLFTWEPPLRLEDEWSIYTAVVPQPEENEIRRRLSFFAWLQAESREYELFCVAEPV